MEYKLTQHASDAIEKRRISIEWVERILNKPDWTEPDALDEDLQHRLGSIKEFEERVLRVIINMKASPPRIVTAYFDRRSKKP